MKRFTEESARKLVAGTRLTFLRMLPPTTYRAPRIECRCECGNVKAVLAVNIRRNKTVSCGCYHHAVITKHGRSGTPIYKTWEAMIQRCYNPRLPGYEDYGGRGITVCDRWRQDFRNFFEDMGDKPIKMTIERIENDQGYSPGNCKWATQAEQNRNNRRNRNITIDGKTMCLADWSKQSHVNYGTIRRRISMGWESRRAIFGVPQVRGK